HDELVEMAVSEGLDEDEVRAALATDSFAREVRGDERMAAELAITGVPFFVIEQRYAISGAQPADLILEALERAAAELGGPLEELASSEGDSEGEVCGPDGCAVPSEKSPRG